MKIYKDADATLDAILDKTVAIIGYGNQGRAQALNLRDSGAKVIVGNRDDEYREQAIKDGFEPMTIPEATEAADVLLILTTDECQPDIWDEQIAPGLKPDDTLVWASGYNVSYDLIKPPADVDVVMVAPRMPGNMVRTLFERGSGAVAQFAVHQDASGKALDRALAISKGIGATRGGAFESSFREEAELDLFAEQVIWSGLTNWVLTCFDLGVKHGFAPELMVMELYASGESAEIFGLMARRGFFRQLSHHSTTSQYGTFSRGPSMFSEEVKKHAEELFLKDIRGGAFATEWSKEQAQGSKRLEELWEKALSHPMSQAEMKVIEVMQSAQEDEE